MHCCVCNALLVILDNFTRTFAAGMGYLTLLSPTPSAKKETPETEFVYTFKESRNRFRQPYVGGPVRQPYFLYRLAESIPGLLKSSQIRAQALPLQ
jgi:hypothetical protein